jgi:hypothetical protein
MHDTTNSHLHSFDVIEGIQVFEPVYVRTNVPFQLACALHSSQFQICDGG